MLYKPLAKNDITTVSKIFVSSERFFKKIAYILLGYVVILMIVYPFITIDHFDYKFTLFLILIISLSIFAQYYIGMTYKLLLNADQMGFVQYTVHTIALVLNTIFCIYLMGHGAPVHSVKLTTSLIYILQPILLMIFVRKKYKINYQIRFSNEPIKQKWNGLAQHIATVILNNTDTVILTLFSTLENVSIYAVYHLVVNGIKQVVVSMTNGMQAMLGNMLARNEIEGLERAFSYYEWLLHVTVTFAFSITAVLIIPFVEVYTADIMDANYIVPIFAYLITLAQAAYCYRLPYNILILAAGHYKQTQWSAIIEAIINVLLSVFLVFHYGLIGVAIGTFVAMAYRTGYFVNYLKNNILKRKVQYFIKHLISDGCCVLLLFFIVNSFSDFYIMQQLNYLSWLILAIKVALTEIVVLITINSMFYRDEIKRLIFKY